MPRLSSRFSMRIVGATLLAASAVPCLFAQFRADTRLVVLHASVTDRKGRLMTNLDKDAFRVFENGQLQQVKVLMN